MERLLIGLFIGLVIVFYIVVFAVFISKTKADETLDVVGQTTPDTQHPNDKGSLNSFLSGAFFCKVTDTTRNDAALAWRRLMSLKGLFVILAAIFFFSLLAFALIDKENEYAREFCKLLSGAVLTIMVAAVTAYNATEYFKNRVDMDCMGKAPSTAFPFFDLKNPINIPLAFLYATFISVISLYLNLLAMFFVILILYIIIRSHVIRRSKLIEQFMNGNLRELKRWYVILGVLVVFAICLSAIKSTRAYWAIWLSVILSIPTFLLIMYLFHSRIDGAMDNFIGNNVLKFFFGYDNGMTFVTKMVHTKILDLVDSKTLWKHAIFLIALAITGLVVGIVFTAKYFSKGLDMEQHCEGSNENDSYKTFREQFPRGVLIINITMVVLISLIVFMEEGLNIIRLF